ncbi:hypothetical protein [Helicobacter kayseriensis]|uniref:hypothetical protein n=1 Tax=Helicobacter kayseriensis TaxID=2905877 RepID=UPI001E60B950|nr:hypothetical protein [Helicobacter kayseriensis]MCE3046963.1 hypothetical protein [Helicobacter kayseriensis]MCE3048377.1 hypothetical protein [Helicobacter kayseriensis]
MVKKIFLLMISFLILSADQIDDVVINIMGEDAYQVNQNFVNRLFADKKKFFLDEDQKKIDYYKITKVLKDNGLLYLGFQEPKEVNLGFKAKTKPVFLMRTINGVLSSIGYSYFTVSKAKYTQDNVFLTFSLVSEHGVAPEIILSELKKRGILVSRVARKNQTDWLYELQILDPSVASAIALKDNDRLELKNISGEYWFSVQSAGIMSILKKNSKIGWSPRIVLYDRDLQILEIMTQKDFAVSAEINITDQTAFVMVTDLNNPSRLKSGITVTFFSFDQIKSE